jgi:hypothetical protein
MPVSGTPYMWHVVRFKSVSRQIFWSNRQQIVYFLGVAFNWLYCRIWHNIISYIMLTGVTCCRCRTRSEWRKLEIRSDMCHAWNIFVGNVGIPGIGIIIIITFHVLHGLCMPTYFIQVTKPSSTKRTRSGSAGGISPTATENGTNRTIIIPTARQTETHLFDWVVHPEREVSGDGGRSYWLNWFGEMNTFCMVWRYYRIAPNRDLRLICLYSKGSFDWISKTTGVCVCQCYCLTMGSTLCLNIPNDTQ